jgi:hypothetical protein
MIDRKGRDRLALALRRYLIGRITNDDLEETEIDQRDLGVVAVKQASWHLYSDNCNHRAVGRHAISPETRRQVARWIVFLCSDQEYLWPEYRLDVGFRLGRKWRAFKQAGDPAMWPFLDQAGLDAARRAPRFFAYRRGQPHSSSAESRSDNS